MATPWRDGHSRAASVPATRMSHRHSGPFFHDFSLELPENPLRAALGLESVLEEPISESRLESGDSGCMVAHSLLDFSRRQVGSIKPHKSALSTVVTSLQIPNPFAAEAQWEAIGSSSSLTIQVYFPHTENPTGQLLALSLPANSTVEDAIALALWTYWERRWLPALDASKARDTNIASWIMLVPGKNGAVNKRIAQSKMGHFNFDKYAIVRSPRNLHEKQKVQMQISSFERVPPPPVTVPEKSKRHIRHHSLPILKLGSGRLDAPVSFSRLP
ncbi:hypothetical protein DFH09DRAFT_427446 [Mycena vulgaris]|nr:hypothetical protein DFH09DRAFT_427446 [Mycena vulgaris]